MRSPQPRRRQRRERSGISKRGSRQTAMETKTAFGMPEIPGMWYDPVRNRYFRITREHRAPNVNLSPPSAPEERPTRLLPPSMYRMLHDAQLGRRDVNTCRAPAMLFGANKPKTVSLRYENFCLNRDTFNGSIVHEPDPNRIGLFSFPDGRCLDELNLSTQPRVLGIDWYEPARLLAILVPIRNPSSKTMLFFCRFGNPDIEARVLCAIAIFDQMPHAVSIGEGGISTACDSRTSIRSLVLSGVSEKLRHPDHSAGLAVKRVSTRETIVGTRAGNVYKWDLNAPPSHPVWVGSPPQSRSSVTDFKLSADGHTIYVSRMRNELYNLAAWDMRMSGEGRRPLFGFDGHVNSHKPLHFDLDEEWSRGLLLAGGDDSCVRAWDSKVGGQPLWSKSFPDELPESVRMVPWQRYQSNSRPGAWVVTNRNTYTMELGAIAR